jgi:phosphate transport system permease protein
VSALALTRVSPRRRRADRLARGLVALLTLLALIPLVLIVYYLLEQGAGAIGPSFFTTDPTGSFLGDPGGIKSAILGTLLIVGLATAVAVPVGIGVAVWLVELGRGTRLALAVRYAIDVMTGVPSIVFGLFVYLTLVLAGAGGSSFAGWKGSVALALLMLPIVVRSAEVVLLLVPDTLREAAYALGAPRWKTIARVVLPTALPGLVTGMLLAVARAAGETAPLLFTAAAVNGTTFDLGERMSSLPALIFQNVGQAQDRLVRIAWGAALTLVALILVLTMLARLIQQRSRLS